MTDRRYANRSNSVRETLRIPDRGNEVAVRAGSGVLALYHPAIGERRFVERRAERLSPAV